MFLNLSKLGFGSGSSNTGARTHLLFIHVKSDVGWNRVMVIFWWSLLFCHQEIPKGWVAVISWLNCLILTINLWGSSAQHLVKLAVDPTLDSSALLHIQPAASDSFHCYMFVWLTKYSPPTECHPVTSWGRISGYGGVKKKEEPPLVFLNFKVQISHFSSK